MVPVTGRRGRGYQGKKGSCIKKRRGVKIGTRGEAEEKEGVRVGNASISGLERKGRE